MDLREAQASSEQAPSELEPVADDVFAFVQPGGGWCVNNAGVVVGSGMTVIIDTAATQARASRLRDAVTAVAGDGPHLLVNTHHHGDHVFGNALFAPHATIVAHERARTEMIEAGLGLRQLWPDVDWGDLPLTPPTLTFRDAVTIHAGELRIELIYVGSAAHTTNDVVAWIPDRSVLFCGDVAMAGVTPYCLMGSIDGSLRAIEQLRALGPRTVVTGHGPVAGPEVFDATEMYLRWVRGLAEDGRRSGLSALAAAREADLGEFGKLVDPERLVGNLHRAYAELAGAPPGAPLDVLASFREMAEYNGGLPACHA
jgi:cyclase